MNGANRFSRRIPIRARRNRNVRGEPALYRNLVYNTLTDFNPVVLIAEQPMALIARNDLPAGNLQEFIAYTKTPCAIELSPRMIFRVTGRPPCSNRCSHSPRQKVCDQRLRPINIRASAQPAGPGQLVGLGLEILVKPRNVLRIDVQSRD
jgi:hypothetical protein